MMMEGYKIFLEGFVVVLALSKWGSSPEASGFSISTQEMPRAPFFLIGLGQAWFNMTNIDKPLSFIGIGLYTYITRSRSYWCWIPEDSIYAEIPHDSESPRKPRLSNLLSGCWDGWENFRPLGAWLNHMDFNGFHIFWNPKSPGWLFFVLFSAITILIHSIPWVCIWENPSHSSLYLDIFLVFI